MIFIRSERCKLYGEIAFEKRWAYVQKGVTKLIRIIEGEPESIYNSEQYMEVYSTIYSMCTQRPDYSQQLYDKYREVFVDYTEKMVLPSLREKHGEDMLRELVKRWTNHKVMVKWLTRLFHYVDRYFVFRRHVPSLSKVALTCFHNLVYLEMHTRARKAVIALILKEREGEEIDRELVKNVLNIYVENGMGTMEKYEEDFEKFMLQDTISYYSLKASKWIQEDSCPDYMLESEVCLERERKRVTHYLHSSTEPKLIEALKEAFEILSKEGANEKLNREFLDWCYVSR